jgi:hypothetical protein
MRRNLQSKLSANVMKINLSECFSESGTQPNQTSERNVHGRPFSFTASKIATPSVFPVAVAHL